MNKETAEKQFLQDAAGLCQSEANRWEGRDPKTFDHWNRVAMLLRAEFLVSAAPTTPSSDVIRQMYEALQESAILLAGLRLTAQWALAPEVLQQLEAADEVNLALLSHPELKRYGGGK